jgi:hypothetical protein
MIQQAVKVLQQAFGQMDPHDEGAQAVLQCITKLTKIAPPAQGAPGVGVEALRNLFMQARQQAPLAALMQQQQQAQPPAGGAAPPAA